MRLSGLWWWIDRWRKSSAFTGMTLEEQGAYRNILDEAALRGGPIPNNEDVLARACGDARRWRKVRPAVMARFVLSADGWRNETMDEVITESKRRAEKQRSYRNRTGNATGNKSGNADQTNPVTDGDLSDPETDPDSQKQLGTEFPAHARKGRFSYAGKILEVPKFLEEEFVKRLNGQVFDLTGFYEALDKRLAQTGEPWDLRWIREQFAAETPQPERRRLTYEDDRPFTADEKTKAERVRRNSWGGRCHHDPKCESASSCIAAIIRGWRSEVVA